MSYDKRVNNVKDVLLPRFNKMAIFDVAKNRTPHSVTQVA